MQRIDYNAIVKNALFFKKLLGRTRLCAVLKNNAYGHGLVRTAGVLQGIVDCVAVGNVAEAIAVKPYFKDVLVLLPQFGQDAKAAVQKEIALTVDSVDTLLAALDGCCYGMRPSVHLKVDTGMNRLGFTRRQLSDLACSKQLKQVAVDGVFSHFYGDTLVDCDRQFARFEKCRESLPLEVSQNAIFHIANTSAVLLDDKYHLDMARVGLGLYGYGHPTLQPAKTVEANVLAVRTVRRGETVGYGATHTFTRNTRIAVLDCGYAKGFSRALDNAQVLLHDKLCKVVGNICMAMCMVDVEALPVRVGDKAILLGNGLNNANNKVIVYELLCNLR